MVLSEFDRELRLAGVFCNRIGSRSHLNLLREAVTQPPVIGGLPNDPALTFPERHLGLRTADEHAVPDSILAALGEAVGQWCDLEAILTAANSAATLENELSAGANALSTPRCRIGIAFDEAFHFYYEYNLNLLRSLGAELRHFSLISDRKLPDLDGLYVGGGYPELHAEALSANHSMREQIAAFAARGGTIYGECGGLIYLSCAITTLEGQTYPMAGVIPAQAIVRERLQALGYVEVETRSDSILGPAGLRFRGHKFRYSELKPLTGDLDCAYRLVRRRDGQVMPEGYRLKNLLASYVHAHWASNPPLAEGPVEACARGANGEQHEHAGQ